MNPCIELIKSILACPKCKGDLVFEDASLLCVRCGIAYPVVDGIPVFQSSPATSAEKNELDWTDGKTHFARRRTANRVNQEEAHVLSPAHKFAHGRARMALVLLLRRISKAWGSRLVLDIGNGGNPIFSDVETLVAIDLSFDAMRKLSSSGVSCSQPDKPSIAVVTGKAQELPFKDDSFDITFCSGLLHHLGGQQKSEVIAVTEMRRVTRSGGFMLALEPNLFYPSGILMNLVGTLSEAVFTNRFGFVPHERSLSPMKLVSFLRKAGFSNTGVLGSTYTWNKLPLAIQHGIANSIDRLVRTPPFSFLSWWTIVYARK